MEVSITMPFLGTTSANKTIYCQVLQKYRVIFKTTNHNRLSIYFQKASKSKDALPKIWRIKLKQKVVLAILVYIGYTPKFCEEKRLEDTHISTT